MRTFCAAVASCVLLTNAAFADPAEKARLTPNEIAAMAVKSAGAGTSGIAGIQTTILQGDPSKPGIYTIRLNVPANTKIAAHTHRDSRAAVVMSGTWYFGYGSKTDAALTKPLTQGSFYTEPGEVAHFAITKTEPVTVIITGYGPTDTVYVNAADDPKNK